MTRAYLLARVLVAWLRCALRGRGREATLAILAVTEHADDDADTNADTGADGVSWSSRAPNRAPTRREWAGAVMLCVVVALAMAAAYFKW